MVKIKSSKSNKSNKSKLIESLEVIDCYSKNKEPEEFAELSSDFKLKKVPAIKLKSMSVKTFKAFDDVTFYFDKEGCSSFVCMHGKNGCGKTTILDAIQLCFTRFEGRVMTDLESLLSKNIRHSRNSNPEDFSLSFQIESSFGDYEVRINKMGFVKGYEHPPEIQAIVYRLCYYAKFDQELANFQLNRKQWTVFKDLFESVTGFTIEEKSNIFSMSEDPAQKQLMNKYVLEFLVHKPDETISNRMCSAGERKIIKSFSTLLNMEIKPRIILIDNITMHIQEDRHICLIEAIKRCFPESQIFSAVHSHQVSRNFGSKSQLYDLRLIKANELVKSQPWRLYYMDEIEEFMSKIKATSIEKSSKDGIDRQANKLIKGFSESASVVTLLADFKEFLSEAEEIYLKDIMEYYSVSEGKIT